MLFRFLCVCEYLIKRGKAKSNLPTGNQDLGKRVGRLPSLLVEEL